ncbi:MAG: acetate--CoA ligase family protein, partial [bacterium]
YGLSVTDLDRETKTRLKKQLVSDASVNNPVDLLAGAQPEQFQSALRLVLQDNNVDAVVVIFVAPIITDPTQVAQRISEVSLEFSKPVLGCFMGVKGVATGIEELHRQRLPAYPFPESAVRTLSAMVKYRNWLEKDKGELIRHDVDAEQARAIVAHALAENRSNLLLAEIVEILGIYGIPFIESKTCHTLEELLAAATGMKFPVALKVSSEKVVHKSELGAVKLGIRTNEQLAQAFQDISNSLEKEKISPDDVSFTLQEFLEGGREVIMGLHYAPGFGSLIMFGLGGIYVEVLEDVVFRITPITDRDAEEMIHEIKGLPILQGIRGEKSVSLGFLKEMLLRLSQIAQDIPEIKEMDLNPFLVFSDVAACKAVDARASIDGNGLQKKSPAKLLATQKEEE